MNDMSLPTFLSPMNDFVFKDLFGQEKDHCRFILIDFLHSVLFEEDNGA